MPEQFVDPYLDSATGVLRNLLGASTYAELRNAEGEFVALRMNEFFERPIPRMTGTLNDFACCIKRCSKIFTIGLAKCAQLRSAKIPTVQSTFFLLQTFLSAWNGPEPSLKRRYARRNASLRFCPASCLPLRQLQLRSSFSEGNGRVQRLFWTLLCHEAGYDLDWRTVSGKENDEASRLAAENRDLRALEDIFKRISTPCDPGTPINRDLLTLGH